MSLRIVMVGACPYPVPQGSQVLLRDTALALYDRGHDMHLVVYGYGIGRDTSELKVHRSICPPGLRNTAAGPSLIKPWLDLAMVYTLRRVVRRHKIDVVFAHNYEALLVALAAGTRPIVYHAHNAMSDELPYYFIKQLQGIAGSFGRWLDRHFPRRADRIVAPHQRLAGHLIVRGCDHRKTSIVPPPIEAELFMTCVIEKEMPPVLYAGNLDMYQNLGLLFAAMRHVRKAEPEARLIIATADQDTHLDDAETMHTPNFDALKKVLAKDCVFALPRVSWSGYPIKLLNAMAAGNAIVACRSAAYPLTHEHNGLIVPDNDENAFAEALLQLMRNPRLRAELGRNARETIVTQHDPAHVAEQLENIALQLVKPEQVESI